MMIKYTITKGEWKKISAAGESGTAWLKSADGFYPRLVFSHTDSTQTYNPDDDPDAGVLDDNIPYAEAIDLDEEIGLIWKTNEVTPIMEAENGNDVWYCTLKNGDVCEIIADFL